MGNKSQHVQGAQLEDRQKRRWHGCRNVATSRLPPAFGVATFQGVQPPAELHVRRILWQSAKRGTVTAAQLRKAAV